MHTRSVRLAELQANLIRSRLVLMDGEHWELVLNGATIVATHALMAAAVKHSRLLADFMDISLRELYHRLDKVVPKGLWSEYLQGCKARDSKMPVWSYQTQSKLRQTVYRALSQAGYFSDTRNLELRHVDIAPEIRSYLVSQDEQRVLNCLEVCP